MGAIARSSANFITTSGVVLKGAVNNDSFDNVTALPSSFGDGITLISSQTASNSASISFTTGIDSTYKIYKFVFSNINPVNNDEFMVNFSTDAGSNYNVTKTTTFFTAVHDEADVEASLGYGATRDLAQSTDFQKLTQVQGNGADESCSGSLYLFSPSSSTYVKHFISNINSYESSDYSLNAFVAGYCNTTSPVNAVQFKIETGNFDGTIYLYGIK